MIIRLSDCPLQPWKNGLGSTREIAVHPACAGIDDFMWRVSIAEVDSAAPFSSFPGIDRQIALLDGNGFTMTLDDDRAHSLTTPFTPFAFAGEAKVAVTLVDGPTRDFNLMVRRARAQGELQCRDTPGSHRLAPDIVLVHCARGTVDTSEGQLHAGDAWLPGGTSITLAVGAVVLVVRITALS
ncbi:HutD family protein [Rhodanobacter glycinis]|uniref:HutD family protein n=1 Tax=Rhodanobacter glycinis TaxID=582702 RepID=A0A502FDZ9_9GAMM|nr:HutD family protein [Rhodanobacter glycinis]TPG11586.1 HutD family protein [Rhodanobacter glycinis]TPG47561.1 HutD family protein [Rhodanobacter glycinis]